MRRSSLARTVRALVRTKRRLRSCGRSWSYEESSRPRDMTPGRRRSATTWPINSIALPLARPSGGSCGEKASSRLSRRSAPLRSRIRFEADLPNEMWQADITAWQLASGEVAEILDLIDDHSRLHLGSCAYARVKAADVVENEAGLPWSLVACNRWLWMSSLTTPTFCMKAYTLSGPTNRYPWDFNLFANASARSVDAGRSAMDRGARLPVLVRKNPAPAGSRLRG